ncbi:hypothetical protein RND81_01G141400 [Saponaria officinalis]|uniref:Uncharacterized protein n=1 Tax=Saponaria officinalis TaxID=3572 RepID=A0AAW1NFP1_SAPOF
MTYEKFVPKPWGRYTGVPAQVWERFHARDCCRLYLPTPFGSYWYLGERLAHQTVFDRLVVPSEPPAVLFVQTPDAVARSMEYFEGSGEGLMMYGEDYGDFARRLAPRTIEVYDPDMVEHPPEFYEEADYEYGGARHVVRLDDDVPTMVADYGMDSWSARVKKVAGDIHRSIWRKANRWRELAARRTRELCQSRAETERMRAERDEFERGQAEERQRRQEEVQRRVEAERQRVEAEEQRAEAERRSAEYERGMTDYERQVAEYERQLAEWRRLYPDSISRSLYCNEI